MLPSEHRDDPIIDLDTTSQPNQLEDGPQPRPPTPPRMRYLLTIVATALVAVAATLLIIGPPSQPYQPQNLDELGAWLYEELTAEAGDDVELVSVTGTHYAPGHVAVPEGAHRLAAKCGMLAGVNHESEASFILETTDTRYDISMACPSKVIWLDESFEFEELTPVSLTSFQLQEYRAAVVAIAFVPEEE